jgi:hypothetical protein
MKINRYLVDVGEIQRAGLRDLGPVPVDVLARQVVHEARDSLVLRNPLRECPLRSLETCHCARTQTVINCRIAGRGGVRRWVAVRVRTFAERVLELTADDGDEVLKVEEGEALLHDHAAPGHQVARLLEGHLRVCAFEGGGEGV